MLNIKVNSETGELHGLEGCPGSHPDEQKSCSPDSVACLSGAIDDLPDHSRGVNGVLAYFSLLAGSSHVMGVTETSPSPKDTWSSARLYVNENLFFTDGAHEPLPVWAVIVRDCPQENLSVTVYTSLLDAQAVYRQEVIEFYGGTYCPMGLYDHGVGERCDCREVCEGQLDRRALIARAEHCLISTHPEARCICDIQVGMGPFADRDLPSFGEHLDHVVATSFISTRIH